MPLHLDQSGAHTVARLDGDFTIFHAAELKTALADALHQAQTLELDLSGVDEIDSSGVQLLLLLKREAARHGKQAAFTRHSAAVLGVIDLLNLASTLGDPVLIQNPTR